MVLAVSTHPDDEGIFFGGLLPYYAAGLQLPTVLVSLTSGDWYPTNLTVREAELRCAASKYGLSYEPLFPRFKDVSNSLPNNPYSNPMDATWDYWADGVLQGDGSDVELGKRKAISYLAEQIRRYRPEIVMTQDQNGEYGHYNHIAAVYAVTNAFFLAADPSATNANLIDLPPWQAKKLYLHLFPQNRLFHPYLEIPIPELSNLTCRQMADHGLDCHVSQRSPDVSTVYRTGENFDGYHSEWWGLYYSSVGPDTVMTNATLVNGYTVPPGVALGNFLENLQISNPSPSPEFIGDSLMLPIAYVDQAYAAPTASTLVRGSDLLWGESFSFEKLSGPAWLTVSAAGDISGTPGLDDLGTNIFQLRVVNSTGLHADASVFIEVVEPAPAIANLVGWWKLDETFGNVCSDSAFPPQDGVSSAVVLGSPGAASFLGTAAQFNGTNAKVDVPYAAELNPTQFTAALWVKLEGGAGTYRSPLTSREAIPMAGYIFYADQNNLWQFWVGSGSAWRKLSAGAAKTNEWMHLVGTYDGTSAKFYTNGSLAATMATSFRPNANYPLRIGSGGTESSGQYWFPGWISDVRVYNVAMTAGQIAALHSNTPPRFISELPSASVMAGTRFTGSLQGLAADDDDTLTYSKLSGPDWLRVGLNGALSGLPKSSHVGLNHFIVAATDSFGAQSSAPMNIQVLPGQLPAVSLISAPPGGPARLTLTGTAGQIYVIEGSTDLQPGTWVPVATNSTGASLFEWVDPDSAQQPMRFYRTLIP